MTLTFTDWWEQYKQRPISEGASVRGARPPFHDEATLRRVALAAWQDAQANVLGTDRNEQAV